MCGAAPASRKQMNKIEPLELKQAILRELDAGVVAVGGGKRIFPYAAVEVRLHAGDEAARVLLRAALVDNGLLETAVREHLCPPRCEQAEPRVKVTFTTPAGPPPPPGGFELIFDSGGPSKGTEAYLEVLEGLANRRQILLQHRETYIGRTEFPPTKRAQVIRKNDLYFLDPREQSGRVSKELKANEGVNKSVSRMHAIIIYDEKDDRYYVYDDGSSKGTTLLRGGRGVAINVDPNVGKALESGDVLCFGKAKVKFKLVRKGDAGSGKKTPD
jgi:hypothetical protein